jgi:glutathione S-transferase
MGGRRRQSNQQQGECMFDSQITLVTAVVTILALLFYFYTGINVGQTRTKHNCPAPAMSGAPEFERAMRVQMNTLEWLPTFVVLLWLATLYFSRAMTIGWLAWLPPVFGLIWIIGRIVYMNGYMAAAEKRGTGFSIALIGVVGLLIMAVIGIVMAWGATTAV